MNKKYKDKLIANKKIADLSPEKIIKIKIEKQKNKKIILEILFKLFSQ